MRVRSPPTNLPRDFWKCEMSWTVVFLVSSGNLNFPCFHFAMPFWGVILAEKWGKRCKEPCPAGLGSAALPGLTFSYCLMRHVASGCGCNLIFIVYLFCWKYFGVWYCRQTCVLAEMTAELGCTLVSSFQKPAKSSSKLTALFESSQKCHLSGTESSYLNVPP